MNDLDELRRIIGDHEVRRHRQLAPAEAAHPSRVDDPLEEQAAYGLQPSERERPKGDGRPAMIGAAAFT